APEVAQQPAREERQPEVGGEHQRDVVPMLEGEQAVALEIGDVAEVLLAARVLAHHPADVREPEASQSRVGVPVQVIHVEVMDIPLATRKMPRKTHAPVEKPCLAPYQGTSTAAAKKVNETEGYWSR